MAAEQYIRIGSTKKPHGLKGELKVFIEEDYLEDFLQARVLFLKTGSNMLPHFLKQVRGGNFLIAHFEDCDSRTAADQLAGKELFLRESDMISDEDRQLEADTGAYAHCVGYTLLDETLGTIGPIDRIESYPEQEMAVVWFDGKNRLVPLHLKLIVSIDEEQRLLKVDLPEGLLGL